MRFLIVDDDFNARTGTALTLTSMRPGSTILEARGVTEAIAALQRQPNVDLVILDLHVEDSRGIATLKAVRQWCEEHDVNPRLVVVSAGADYDHSLIPEAIEHCATGFVAKGVPEPVFRSAIELTLAGGIYVPERYLQSRMSPPRAGAVATAQVALTRREQQVVHLLQTGLSYKQIARKIEEAEPGHEMSEGTVRVHVQRVAWKIKTSTGDARWEDLPAKAAVVTYYAGRGGPGSWDAA